MKERLSFPEKQKLKDFINTRPTLQEMLTGVCPVQMKRHYSAAQKAFENIKLPEKGEIPWLKYKASK